MAAFAVVGSGVAESQPAPLGLADPDERLAAPVAKPVETARVTPEVAARAQEARSLPLAERIEHISAPWLGLPYALGPLGEAAAPDPDPVIRYDVFDCLTFVEEVLALALGTDAIDAQRVRMALRYRSGGPYTYENRRHFMLAEWIPGVVEEGWLTDITHTLPGAVSTSKTVTPRTWAGWGRRSLFPLSDARLPVGTQQFWFVPMSHAAEAADHVPPGSVVFTLRKLWDHLPIAISHVGITVPGEEATMRHASRMGKRVVRDDSLRWYAEHLKTYVNWPAEGLIVLAPLEAGPSLAHLASAQAAAAAQASAPQVEQATQPVTP